MARLDAKTALITGGASGIGGETARMMIREGAKVAIADVQEEAGRKLASELGSNAAFVHLDVSNEASWESAVPEAEAALGNFHIWVNAAGVSVPAAIEMGANAHTPAFPWAATSSVPTCPNKTASTNCITV